MKRVLPLVVLVVAAAHQVEAQAYGQQKKSFRFAGDSLMRYEWTREIPTLDGKVNESRYFVQARPRIELDFGPVELGVGGQFNYSKDDNTLLPSGEPRLIVRDNFYSRKALFDLYYAKVKMGPVEGVGGRMIMPFFLTGMIWDEDLRPFGGALSLDFDDPGGSVRFALRGLYATESHWFPDESEMFGGTAELGIKSGQNTQLVLSGSYLDFRDLSTIDPQIRRQNTRNLLGFLLYDYRVADLQARIVGGGPLPYSLVVDYCWNTAVSEGNKGLWMEVTMGALASSRARLAYTYAKIDRDATVAAFNADDFYWGSGYQAHRIDLGGATSKSSSMHAIASWQRFKDSPIPEEREEWVQRYRLEWRYTF